jgi:hypothetical protein
VIEAYLGGTAAKWEKITMLSIKTEAGPARCKFCTAFQWKWGKVVTLIGNQWGERTTTMRAISRIDQRAMAKSTCGKRILT